MSEQNSCYYYKSVHRTEYERVWDCVIDCCYILVMEHSKRIESILKQIESIPVSQVIFQFNKGFKTCKKLDLKKQQSNYDICHANKQCFQHALDHGYQRVLVLEDDCLFDDRIHDVSILHSIRNFLVKKNPMVYNLGPCPFIANPFYIFNDHIHAFAAQSAHAMIYDKRYMLTYIQDVTQDRIFLNHIDAYNSLNMCSYTYKKPIAYQLYTDTENSQTMVWGLNPFIQSYIVKPLQLDKKHQPGFDIIFLFGKWFLFFLCILCTFIIYCCRTIL